MPRPTKANPKLSKLKTSNARKQLRKERYRHFLLLGFSTIEARRFRDHGSPSIERNVESERERIAKIRAPKRTELEQKKIRGIRAFNRRQPAVEFSGRNKTRSDRWEEFSSWTKNRNFPVWAMAYIQQKNADKDLDPLDSFGFRRFYHRYVQNRSEAQAAKFADRDDS